MSGRQFFMVVLLLCGPWSLSAADQHPLLLPTNHLAHVHRALDHLNMLERDMGFEKDAGEPSFALARLRRMLSDPLDLPRMGDEILEAVRLRESTQMWRFAAGLLELRQLHGTPPESSSAPRLAATLDIAIERFCHRAAQADTTLRAAVEGIPMDERRRVAALLLGGMFNMDDDPEVRRRLEAMGIPRPVIEGLRIEQDAIDPEPSAQRLLKTIETFDLASVLVAAEHMVEALEELQTAALAHSDWPVEPQRVQVESFAICIGTPHDDVFESPALLILDPGGDDLYTRGAASADGTRNHTLSVVLDLGGDDRYEGTDLVGPGSAIFGLCLIRDVAGDDIYRAVYTGQAAALFGAAGLEDRAGDDFYEAHAFAQAAGYAGVGILEDTNGRDTYNLGFNGQGFAGVRGVGILIDRSGGDLYLAGRRRHDYGRYSERYLSLAQGFSIGMRPFAGGGVAALVDLEGNDIYRADVYGQGVSYWYSAGFLLDGGGHDSYDVHEYGQGSGIHLSAGLLYDASGDDRYVGHSLSQGNAHDYAVGMLLDHAGNDTYTADHYSQGRGINNALGLLLDAEGRDAYFGRQPDSCQGIGHNGGRREYGCIGLLLDLAGKDRYTCGAEDGLKLERPDYGVVYDVD